MYNGSSYDVGLLRIVVQYLASPFHCRASIQRMYHILSEARGNRALQCILSDASDKFQNRRWGLSQTQQYPLRK
jgi:hypothetical protein